MARILEMGFGFGDEETVKTIDIHDQTIDLTERVLSLMLTGAAVCCDDFLCEDEDLAFVIAELESPHSNNTKH